MNFPEALRGTSVENANIDDRMIDGIKKERYEILRELAPEMWSNFETTRQLFYSFGSPYGLGYYQDLLGTGKEMFLRYTSVEQVSPAVALHNTLRHSVIEWYEGIISGETPPGKKWVREAVLRNDNLLDRSYLLGLFKEPMNTAQNLSGGLGTSVFNLDALYRLIPELFLQQFGTKITRQQYVELISKNTSLANLLAQGHSMIVLELLENLRIVRSDQERAIKRDIKFDPSFFYISPHKGIQINRKGIVRGKIVPNGRDIRITATKCIALNNHFEVDGQYELMIEKINEILADVNSRLLNNYSDDPERYIDLRNHQPTLELDREEKSMRFTFDARSGEVDPLILEDFLQYSLEGRLLIDGKKYLLPFEKRSIDKIKLMVLLTHSMEVYDEDGNLQTLPLAGHIFESEII